MDPLYILLAPSFYQVESIHVLVKIYCLPDIFWRKTTKLVAGSDELKKKDHAQKSIWEPVALGRGEMLLSASSSVWYSQKIDHTPVDPLAWSDS